MDQVYFDHVSRNVRSSAAGIKWYVRRTTRQLRQEIKESADGVKRELRQEIKESADGVKRELRQEIKESADGVKRELRQEIKESADKLTELFHLEAIKNEVRDQKIDTVYDGILTLLNDRQDRKILTMRMDKLETRMFAVETYIKQQN